MERNTRLDGIKILLIFLVVLGHCIEPSRYSNPVSGGLYSIIYSFHMPLFIFLSGYFAKVNSFSEWKDKAIRFFESYFVVMLPWAIINRSWIVFLSPQISGWYLMSMAWWYGMLLLLKRINNGKILWGVIISMLASFAVFLLPIGQYGGILSFNRTLQMFPFFYVGQMCKNNNLSVPYGIKTKFKLMLGFLTGIAVILLAIYSCRSLHVLEFWRDNVWYISGISGIPVVRLLLFRLLLIVCAGTISIFVVENIRLPNRLSELGSSTLVIFVIQGWLAHFIPTLVPNNIFIELGVASIIIALSIVIIKTIDSRYITNPVTIMLQNVNYKYMNKKSNSSK